MGIFWRTSVRFSLFADAINSICEADVQQREMRLFVITGQVFRNVIQLVGMQVECL